MDLRILVVISFLKTTILALMANTGQLELKGEKLRYIGRELVDSKNVSSEMECHLFCLAHKSHCKSMNVEEIAVGTPYLYQCQSFNIRKNPENLPIDFEESERSNYYTLIRESITERSCQDWKNKGFDKDDFYVVTYSDEKQTKVFCEMKREDGPWLLIQRRTSSRDFYKTWENFKGGFGKGKHQKDKPFWLGNHLIYELTKSKSQGVDLLIEAVDSDGKIATGRYAHFSIKQETEYFRLSSDLIHVSGFSGFETLAGFSFATKDRSSLSAQTCVNSAQTAWWFGNDCNVEIDLNQRNSFVWNALTANNSNVDIVKTTMMIKV
eukprot:TCONS_00066826-protein